MSALGTLKIDALLRLAAVSRRVLRIEYRKGPLMQDEACDNLLLDEIPAGPAESERARRPGCLAIFLPGGLP